jgi:murein DD-endopeptidase MepM/ murein hydrolase activator NlpD
VKINHGGGVTTIYGHMLKRPSVSAGEYVEAGDTIGLMGSTYDRAGGGYSTGVHLHFTVKIDGKAVNPMKYLP